MQIEQINDIRLLRKMVEAGAAHASRVTKDLQREDIVDDHAKEQFFALEEIHYELLRARRRLEELERNLEDSAS